MRSYLPLVPHAHVHNEELLRRVRGHAEAEPIFCLFPREGYGVFAAQRCERWPDVLITVYVKCAVVASRTAGDGVVGPRTHAYFPKPSQRGRAEG